PASTLFPYTTLFRSTRQVQATLDEASLSLADQFARREVLSFNVNVNGTQIEVTDATSMQDVLAKINAETPNTGVSAYLNASNTEDRKSTRLNSSHVK